MKPKTLIFTPELNSTFFVVASTLNEFSFCAAFNEMFGVTLRLAPSVNENTVHNLYTSNDELRHISVEVLVNKALRSVCFDFLENIDYVIRVNNISTESEQKEFQEQISRMEQCIFAQKLDLTKISSKQIKQLQLVFV